MIFTPEAIQVISLIAYIAAVAVVVLMAIALIYIIAILHKIHKASSFLKDAAQTIKRDFESVLGKIFNDENIKKALAGLFAWGIGVFKTIKKKNISTKRTSTKKTKTKKEDR